MRQEQVPPYLLELRDTIDSALYRFEQLQKAAAETLSLNRSLAQQAAALPGDFDREAWNKKMYRMGTTQTHIFDHLEAFLAAWARVSLLIFPQGGKDELADFRQDRGRHLQSILRLTRPEVLEDRGLRDSWMHFDERLDRAVVAGSWGSRTRFTTSDEAETARRVTLRVVELDTLLVHYRDRVGNHCATSLYALRDALEDAREKERAAWAGADTEAPQEATE